MSAREKEEQKLYLIISLLIYRYGNDQSSEFTNTQEWDEVSTFFWCANVLVDKLINDRNADYLKVKGISKTCILRAISNHLHIFYTKISKIYVRWYGE